MFNSIMLHLLRKVIGMRKQFLFGAIGTLVFISTLWIGCSKSTEPSATSGTASMVSTYSTGQLPPLKGGGFLAVDSVKISRARFVLRDIKLKSTTDSLNFKSGPTMLELNLSGTAQTLTAREIPFASYRRIEFDVHRVESTEVALLPLAERAVFNDFLAGERYSVIIEGTVYNTGAAPQTFIFRSKIDAQQKFDLVPELVVSEVSPTVNTTMLISSVNWFKSQIGVLLDPSNINNESQIGENLKASIRVFKDNNKDGSKDNS